MEEKGITVTPPTRTLNGYCMQKYMYIYEGLQKSHQIVVKIIRGEIITPV